LKLDRTPVLLCFDVEPDDHFFPPDRPSGWHGFDFLSVWIEEYRALLAEASGEPVRFGWFLRMDPQIRVAYGSAAYAAEANSAFFDRVLAQGDVIGVHPHFGRWDAAAAKWVVDIASASWVDECIESSFDAYHSVFGVMPTEQRLGSGWWNSRALDLAEQLGARFDLTGEPGEIHTTPGKSPRALWLGDFPDLTAVPQGPYQPSPGDVLRPADPKDGRLWEIPLTSGDYVPPATILPKLAARLRHPVRTLHNVVIWAERAVSKPHSHRPEVRLMAMWRPWRSAQDFWNAAERRLEMLKAPYLAFALRTDVPIRSSEWPQTRKILDYVLNDSLATRLLFTTPKRALLHLGLLPVRG
jgi:hypothetical protein